MNKVVEIHHDFCFEYLYYNNMHNAIYQVTKT